MIIVTAAVTARLFVRGYAEYLAALDYEVTLVADDLSDLEHDLLARGVKICSLPMARTPSPWQDAKSLLAMLRLIHKIRPDVVMYATPKASLIAAISARILHVPVRVYLLWGLRLETYTGVKRRILRSFEWLISSVSTTVLANSRSLATQAAEINIVRSGKIAVLGNGSSHGVDAQRFSPDVVLPDVDPPTARFLDENPGFTVGYVGRLHPDKGVGTLISAAGLLFHEGFPVRVLLVGGDEGLRVINNNPVAPVHLTGEVSDVRPYIRNIDVLVLMSLREGFPNVVLEAAAMGVPAVVSDATGCVDSVVNDVTGFIIPIGDTERLREVLRKLGSEPALRRQFGLAARRRAVVDFRPEDVWSASLEHLSTTRTSGSLGSRPRAEGRR